jgi:hypothetical protein
MIEVEMRLNDGQVGGAEGTEGRRSHSGTVFSPE